MFTQKKTHNGQMSSQLISYEENSNYIHGFDNIVNVQDVIILKVRSPKPKQTIKLK